MIGSSTQSFFSRTKMPKKENIHLEEWEWFSYVVIFFVKLSNTVNKKQVSAGKQVVILIQLEHRENSILKEKYMFLHFSKLRQRRFRGQRAIRRWNCVSSCAWLSRCKKYFVVRHTHDSQTESSWRTSDFHFVLFNCSMFLVFSTPEHIKDQKLPILLFRFF